MTRNPVLHRLPEQKERRLAVADPTWQLASAMAVAIGVGIVYFLAARFSLSLLTKPDGVAVFWPASGVAAGVLIALGPRAKWPVAIGAAAATIAANLLGDRSIAGAVTFALCNAGEAMLAAGFIQRQFGSGFALHGVRQVIGLLAAAVFGSAISGIGGVLGFKLFHFSTAPTLTIWQHWFASDALGILTVAPLLIGAAAAARDPPPLNEALEGAVALVRDNADDHACYLSTARIIRDCGADCPAVPPVTLASGPLPAGIRRGGRVHRCTDDRVDDNFWHRIFR